MTATDDLNNSYDTWIGQGQIPEVATNTQTDQDNDVPTTSIEDDEIEAARRVQQDAEAAECAKNQASAKTKKTAVNADPDSDDEDGKEEKKSAATMLVELADELFEFGVTPAGKVFGLPRTGPRIVAMLRGGQKSLRAQLAREFYKKHRKAASAGALADALLILEGNAQETEARELHQRIAEDDCAFWLDLGDITGNAVRITGDGWSIEANPPVVFRRTNVTGTLPVPVPGGDLSQLWKWLNVNEADRPLVAAWLVAAFMPNFPHPALTLTGEQGTGKTTATKLCVQLVDPSPAPTRKPPKDMDGWVTAASASWVVGLDNLSGMPEWLSDSLCRAVTGDADVRRELYSDDDLSVFAFRRALVLNGIDMGTLRGDLSERMLSVGLDVITESQRAEEGEFWPMWEDAHPRLLGALLDLTVKVLDQMPKVKLKGKPRMADFARVLAAVDAVLKTDGFERYQGLQARLAEDGLSGNKFYLSISEFVTEEFTGTGSDLFKKLSDAHREADWSWRAPQGWPSTGRGVGGVLKRLAPQMRKVGWKVNGEYSKNKKTDVWTVIPPSEIGDSGN